jgi:hypothetical protein
MSQYQRHGEHCRAGEEKAAPIQDVAHRRGGLPVEAHYQLRVGDQPEA